MCLVGESADFGRCDLDNDLDKHWACATITWKTFKISVHVVDHGFNILGYIGVIETI